jgi:hypothetical protein
MLGHEWEIRYMNGNAVRLTKVVREEVLGRCLWMCSRRRWAARTTAPIPAVDTNEPVSFEEHYAPLDLWTEIRAYPSEEGLTIYFRDISGRKAQEAEIHRMAFYDKLTGLPNRQLLLDALNTRWRWAAHWPSGATLFIDLDHFKASTTRAGMTRATSCCSRWPTVGHRAQLRHSGALRWR